MNRGTSKRSRLNERGIALLLTLLLALLVVSLAIGVLLMMSSTTLVTRFHLTESVMSNFASAGLEQARDTLNGNPTLLPQPTGYVTLELDVSLRDADNVIIPGIRRSTYAGLTGRETGQAGHYASVLSVISNARGPVVIRRADYKRPSFASFERFYNDWTIGSWNPNEAVFGPVHSNTDIRLSASPGIRFWSRVTAAGSIQNAGNGVFRQGYQTGASVIPFPTGSSLSALQPIAASGGLVVAGDGRLLAEDPELRLEFVAIDLNGDGDTADDNEGFFRVFRIEPSGSSRDRDYVNALRWDGNYTGFPTTSLADPNLFSPNCGGETGILGIPTWLTAAKIQDTMQATGASQASQVSVIRAALRNSKRRCYLGGDRRLFENRWIRDVPGRGSWSRWAGWGGSAPAALVNAVTAQGVDPSADPADVALTFWPISQAFNPGFKGVIYVTGSVTVSGLVRGRVTLVAAGNIMIGDDITYVQAPNTTCADILGLVSRQSILMMDNNVNSPFRVNSNYTNLFDDSPDEIIHGFLLAMDEVGADDLGGMEPLIGPEDCDGASKSSRGCRYLVGGIAQGNNFNSYSGSQGWHDQDHYDVCGGSNPPPYYPSTGQFTRYRYFEIDPVGFLPAAWFAANQ
jgi:hypothetical protein